MLNGKSTIVLNGKTLNTLPSRSGIKARLSPFLLNTVVEVPASTIGK